MRCIVIVVSFLVLPALASATTYHIPDDFETIQEAMESWFVVNGDVVLVKPGTYVENVDFLGKAVTLKSMGGINVTIIDGNGQGPVVFFGNGEGADSVLDGFTITNGYGASGGGIDCSGAVTPLIRNNLIIENVADGMGGGIGMSGASPEVWNNLFVGNTAWLGGGIGMSSGAAPMLTNNTFYENTADPAGGAVCCQDYCTPVMKNSILWENTASAGKEIWIGGMPQPSTLTISYSDVQGNTGSVYVGPGSSLDWGSGMIDGDPLFMDPESNDFCLGQSPCQVGVANPCVDSGDSDSEWRRGATRSDGMQDEWGVDMGFHYPEQYHDQDKQYHDPESTWRLFYTDTNSNGYHDPGEPCTPVPGGDSRIDATCWMCGASNVLAYEGYGYHYPEWILNGGAPSPSYHPWSNGAVYADGGGSHRTFDDGGYGPLPFWYMGVTYQSIQTQAELSAGSWKQDPVEWCLARLEENHPLSLGLWSGLVKRGAMPGGIIPGDKWYYHIITLWHIDPSAKTVTITDSDDLIDGPRTLSYTWENDDWIIMDLYPGFRRFHINSATCVSSLLKADDQVIKVDPGGTIQFTLNAGKENANRAYLLLGSMDGTHPGTPLPWGGVLPLNWDFFSDLVMLYLNTGIFQNFMGYLDSDGCAQAVFHAPPQSLVPVGLENIYFAYALYGPWNFASSAVPMQLVVK